MREQSHFQPGQTVVIRILCHGKIWAVQPEIVVRDTPELLAFYKPPRTVLKEAYERIRPAERSKREWTLIDVEWKFGGTLRLSIPGVNYSVILLTNVDGTPYQWYINLEQPLQRTAIGFDQVDEILDVTIAPDLSSWRWLDEDELEETVTSGLMTAKKAAAIRSEGEKAVAWLQSGKSPFNGWEKWRPDPSWGIPTLPASWDVIES